MDLMERDGERWSLGRAKCPRFDWIRGGFAQGQRLSRAKETRIHDNHTATIPTQSSKVCIVRRKARVDWIALSASRSPANKESLSTGE